MRGVKIVTTKPNKELTQLVTARQRADKFCVPYELYLQFAFHFAGRRQRKFAPRPNQLHPTTKSANAWKSDFERFLRDRRADMLRRVPSNWAFRIEAFQELPPQVALRDFVIQEARHCSGWDWAIAEYSLARRIVPAGMFRQVIKNDVFDMALERAATFHIEEAQGDEDDGQELLQTCFGLPSAVERSGPACQVCPQHGRCAAASAVVSARLLELEGSTDPVSARRRLQGRARQQRFREKRRTLPERGQESDVA